MPQKLLLLLLLFGFILSTPQSKGLPTIQSSFSSHLPNDTVATAPARKHAWFIVLPLRFVYLQDAPTLLSGVKLGYKITPKFSTSLSVFHSFYLNSLRPAAQLPAFDKDQPRHFIYSIGAEINYTFVEWKRFFSAAHLYAGWGFVNYNTESHGFKGNNSHYVATEASLNLGYRLGPLSTVELGLGYQPMIGVNPVSYRSEVNSGVIPIANSFPNGAVLSLSLKQHF